MGDYKHVLLAVDFSEHTTLVADRAYDLSQKNGSKLSVLHVVDNLPIADSAYGPVIPFDMDVTEELVRNARERLAVLCQKLAVPSGQQWLEVGSPKLEIIRVAHEKNADLIVVGSHGRHGFALLLGSTANSVLHHAKCDVLAVRLRY